MLFTNSYNNQTKKQYFINKYIKTPNKPDDTIITKKK